MKKFVLILIAILITIIHIPAYAQNDDTFYFDKSHEEVQRMLSEYHSTNVKSVVAYLESNYLTDGEKADESKITFDTDKLYAYYLCELDDVLGYMKAESKADFVKKLPVAQLVYPCYYDGVFLDEFEMSFGNDIHKSPVGISLFNLTKTDGEPGFTKNGKYYFYKEDIARELEQDGIKEYEIIKSLHANGLWFVIAEKQDQIFAIYMPSEITESNGSVTKDIEANSLTREIYQNNKKLFEKRIISISQMELLIDDFERIKSEYMSADGIVSTSGIDGNNEEGSYDFPWEYVGIGAGAVVLVGAIVLLIVLKKKKA